MHWAGPQLVTDLAGRILFLVQTLGYLFGIPLVIQFEQPIKHLAPCLLTDREAYPLLRFVKSVSEIKIGPPVTLIQLVINIHLERSERSEVIVTTRIGIYLVHNVGNSQSSFASRFIPESYEAIT